MTSVVIVDDQTINLRILSRFARAVDTDVQVHTFEDPVAALAFVVSSPPDLIVTDYVMPQIHGEEFIRRCRQRRLLSDIPIIVVTAYEDREYRYRALQAGASDYLISPVDGQEFCTRARNLLTLWRHQQALNRRATLLEGELAAATRQHAEDIRRREELLRRVINTLPALIRASDCDGRIIFLNDAHRQFFDINPGVVGNRTKTDLFGSDYAERHLAIDRAVVASGRMVADIEETVQDGKGQSRVLLTTKAPLPSANNETQQIVTVSLDISERKSVEQAVRESEQRFRNLVEGSVMGIVIDRGGQPIFANRMFARIFGYDEPNEILSLPSIEGLFAPSEHGRLLRWRQSRAWETTPFEPVEYEGIKRDGTLIWIEMMSQEVTWQGEQVLQSTIADITLRKAYEERLQRQANFDEVTGLPNRLLALDRLRSAVVSAIRHRHRGGVLFVDLDHFKKINDTWGHAAGDQLLRMAADRLRSCVREEDTVARLGGDEFTIILPNIASAAHTEPVIQKILTSFSTPFAINRHEAFVTASIGVSVFPDDSDDPATLMQHADAAMYRAKEQGRHTFQFFTPELNERALHRMRLEGHLAHALDRKELNLHYQPIVNVLSGALEGAEVLLRWNSPDIGSLLPDAFVPLAEDTGLILPIGRWTLDTACRQLSYWRAHGRPNLSLSVNVSSRQLRSKGLVQSVAMAIERHGVPASSIELEITEGCLMQECDETGEALRALDRLGIRLALDDFGTGYSRLSYLKELPVDTVKIDKSFMPNSVGDTGNASVVEAVIAMAKQLGIRVIGEGIETREQLEFLRVRGCDLAQGILFSAPLSAEAFEQWGSAWDESSAIAL